MTRTAYLAHSRFLPELQHELKNIEKIQENLVITLGPRQKTVWAQLVIEDFKISPIESIGQAVKILKSEGKFWDLLPMEKLARRGQLIAEQLPRFKIKPLDFLQAQPIYPLGFFTLLESNLLGYSAKTSSPFPQGIIPFNEDKEMPPSRAYLKLWEVMTIYGVRPLPGQTVVDFGSCPGGWTWVLQQCGCNVISIDKAPLEDRIARLPRVEFRKQDAFSLKPQDVGPIDWFFSDIICYPPKLLELVKEWQQSGLCKRFVCTIKYQKETDWETTQRFINDMGAWVQHLYYNKHEVTAVILPLDERPGNLDFTK